MKRFYLILNFTVIVFLALLIFAQNANSETQLRTYKPINIAKGSFLKGVNLREISTSTAKVGDVEYFINPQDVFIGTSKVIPKDSIYLGEVEEVLEAVEGINASMKIKIYKFITPSRKEFPLDANVYWKGSTKIGGDLAAVAYYTKMPHYPGDWKKGALQLCPTTIREMGHPTVLRAGDEITFIINDDLSIYKPLK